MLRRKNASKDFVWTTLLTTTPNLLVTKMAFTSWESISSKRWWPRSSKNPLLPACLHPITRLLIRCWMIFASFTFRCHTLTSPSRLIRQGLVNCLILTILLKVGGEAIRCHKAILAAHSDAFVNLFNQGGSGGIGTVAICHVNQYTDQGQCQNCVASLLRHSSPCFGLSTTVMTTLSHFQHANWLVFLTRWVVPNCIVLSSQFAKLVSLYLFIPSLQYKLHSLLRICEDKIRNNVGIDTVLEIIATAYLPAMAGKDDLVSELKNKCFPFLLDHLCDVDLGPLRTMHPNIAIDIVMRIQEAWRTMGGPEGVATGAAPSSSSSGGISLGGQRSKDVWRAGLACFRWHAY